LSLSAFQDNIKDRENGVTFKTNGKFIGEVRIIENALKFRIYYKINLFNVKNVF
jgi:hypothetical protein